MFSSIALFTVLLINQVRASKDFLPPAIGIATTVVAIVLFRAGILPGQHIILAAIALGLAALVAVRGRKFRAEES